METRKMIVVTWAALSLVFTGACGSTSPVKVLAESQSSTPPNAASISMESLSETLARATVKNLEVSGGTARLKALGFRSTDEVRSATVEAPMTVYRVPLASVGEFDETTNPNGVLVDAQIRFFPVSSAGVVVSGVTVSTAGSAPRVVSVGRGNLAKALSAARDVVDVGEPPFAVDLGDLGMWYVGHHDTNGVLWLTALRADERMPGMAALESMRAERVFAGLKAYSRGVRERPVHL